MDEREFVVILSDIHMGTRAPTVWYRNEVHEKYLITILEDIIIHANQIREVILLGDIFEFWAYSPNETPPSIDDIIATHPNVLGRNGKVCQALSALRGRMIYTPGDHDMNMTQADLRKIISPDGYTIKYHYGAYIPKYDKRILFTHGHEFNLLNTPYFSSQLAPLPISYFVTRAISYQVQSVLTKNPRLTTANLEEYRDYGLTEFLSKLPYFLENYVNGLDFVNKFIDAIVNSTNIPKDLPIQVNKTTSILLNEVKNIYINFFDDFETYLPWYVKNNSFEDFINIVVMGHTHSPSMTFSKGTINYINTGSMCPAISDLTKKPITYEIYNLTNGTVKLKKVMGNTSLNTQNEFLENGNSAIIEKNQNEIVQPKKYTFGWSVYNSLLEFFMIMQMGVLEKAAELEIDVIAHDERSNNIEMVTGSIDMISRGIDALLIAPFNPELLPVIVEDAKRYDIPVIAIDVGTGGADVAAFIVSDNYGGGIYAGEYALILIRKYSIVSTNVAIIKVQETGLYALLRGRGFSSVMEENGFTIIAEIPANSEEPLAYEVMKNILDSYKDDLAVVFCENGPMTLGAARAIDEAGKKGEIMLIGFDSGPSIIEGIMNGSIQGTIAQEPFKMGEIGVEIANSILEEMPITFDNWSERLILMEVYLIDENGEARINIV